MSAPSIATRTGDNGETGLLFGQRVPKTHPQIEAVGRLDELNVALGAIKPHLPAGDSPTRGLIEAIQQNLVALMGEIACAESDVARYETAQFTKLTDPDLVRLDQAIATLESRGLKFDGWATPGGNLRASACDTARVTARRAERQLVALPLHGRQPRPLLLRFINRLSDLLWLLAREAEAAK
jgi:cob(I)alamin adenosyltransferase